MNSDGLDSSQNDVLSLKIKQSKIQFAKILQFYKFMKTFYLTEILYLVYKNLVHQ